MNMKETPIQFAAPNFKKFEAKLNESQKELTEYAEIIRKMQFVSLKTLFTQFTI